jgi:hypothetical protein
MFSVPTQMIARFTTSLKRIRLMSNDQAPFGRPYAGYASTAGLQTIRYHEFCVRSPRLPSPSHVRERRATFLRLSQASCVTARFSLRPALMQASSHEVERPSHSPLILAVLSE